MGLQMLRESGVVENYEAGVIRGKIRNTKSQTNPKAQTRNIEETQTSKQKPTTPLGAEWL
jgi:hypothetical protein